MTFLLFLGSSRLSNVLNSFILYPQINYFFLSLYTSSSHQKHRSKIIGKISLNESRSIHLIIRISHWMTCERSFSPRFQKFAAVQDLLLSLKNLSTSRKVRAYFFHSTLKDCQYMVLSCLLIRASGWIDSPTP